MGASALVTVSHVSYAAIRTVIRLLNRVSLASWQSEEILRCLEPHSESMFGDACKGGVWTGNHSPASHGKPVCKDLFRSCACRALLELHVPPLHTGRSDCSPVGTELLERCFVATLVMLPGSTSNLDSGSPSLPFSTKREEQGGTGPSICIHDVVQEPPYEPRKGPWRFETLRCCSARYGVDAPHMLQLWPCGTGPRWLPSTV